MDGFGLAASVIAAIQPDARNTRALIILVLLEDRRIPALKAYPFVPSPSYHCGFVKATWPY
jgi:hypothetical protein